MTDAPLKTAPARPRRFTVQCGYPAWYSNTVVVEAETIEEACERAIEAANESSAWRSTDYCGPTSVDALAEGDDVDPWSPAGSRLEVPARFTEPDAVAFRSVLRGLLDWAAAMGGWEGEAWQAAARLVGEDEPPASPGE